MMLTFPSLPLKSRTVSFPQYGFKAGISDGAFPSPRGLRVGRFAPVLRAHRLSRLCPVLCRGTQRACALPCERLVPLYPRGPRSGPGYSVLVHLRLIGPMRPTCGHISTSPHCGLYEMPSLCVIPSTPRRPASGSVLSLAIPYRHVALGDPGKFIGCMHPVPSPMSLAFDLWERSRHFPLPPHSDSRGESHFGACLRFAFVYDLSTCSPPCRS
jgi:hypothetical protein